MRVMNKILVAGLIVLLPIVGARAVQAGPGAPAPKPVVKEVAVLKSPVISPVRAPVGTTGPTGVGGTNGPAKPINIPQPVVEGKVHGS
jgi:hypothetical protein